MLDILFGSGIDSLGCMLDAALDLNIVERRGSWYAYKGQQLAQGRTNAVEFLREHEVGSQIANDVRQALANFGKENALGAEPSDDVFDDESAMELAVAEEQEESLFE